MSIFDILGKGKAFRRKAERKKAKFQVRMIALKVKRRKEWTHSEYSGGSVDLSPKGMLLATSAPIEKGDLIRLVFSLSSFSKSIEVQAVVRNAKEGEAGRKSVGLEFVEPSAETQRYLATMLTLYKAG